MESPNDQTEDIVINILTNQIEMIEGSINKDKQFTIYNTEVKEMNEKNRNVKEKEIIELFDRLKEVETLKSNLVDVKTIVDRHENHIVELFGKNKEQDNITVVNLTENTKVNNEHVEENHPSGVLEPN